MKKTILIIIVLTLLGCNKIQHEDLLGRWKSNEKKTVESMVSTPGVPEKTKKYFGENFFGKLIVEYKKDTYKTIFENDEDNIEEFYQFYPYKVLEVTDEYYLIETFSKISDKNEVKKLYKDGACYYIFISKWNFREYFCRMK